MRSLFIVAVEFPHERTPEYTLGYDSLDDARVSAMSESRGNPGEGGYKEVSIYSLVEKVN